ncbi:heparinase II/III domain-containing protein [Catelliglobosispora koreensis]|uniref:heparinase II/III domain-containing protein n=1 Tax=Catelliglobosispora koreensis TaxID=129052 RepID=UPI0003602B84|nr:heparinase II/III family protein [Catelliglobosispora koreensis]
MADSGFLPSPTALAPLVREIELVAAANAMPVLTFGAYEDYFRTGRRLVYEELYFRRRATLTAQVAEALLKPGVSTAMLCDTLWSVCDEYTWALPAHVGGCADPRQCVDLFAAETAHTLAETVAALDSRLDPMVTARVREEIDRRVFVPYSGSLPLAWEGFGNNWESVCGGAVGMAALALLGRSTKDSDRLTVMLDRSRRAMDRFLAGFGDDGGCLEGISYWVYGFGYFVYFAEALREHTGEDLMVAPKIREIAAFASRVALGGGAYASFSDTTDRPWFPAGLLTRLAERFGTPPPEKVPSFHDDHCYRWAHVSRNLAWFDSIVPQVRGQLTSFLPDAGWVIDRGRHAFAAKGGHNDEPHNHNDLGHFILHTHGESVLADLGAAEYTSEYFGTNRYESPYASALGHSVPVVDGNEQLPGRERAARVLHYQANDDGAEFDLELTAAYEVAGLRSLVRRFRWSRSGRLELTDEVTADRPLTVDEMFISRHRPSLSDIGANWSGLVVLEHEGAEASVDELLLTDHFQRPDRVFRLRCRRLAPAGYSAHRFVFRLD